MHREFVASLFLAFAAATVASCSTTPATTPMGETLALLRLPVSVEPEFQRTNHASLPPGTTMIVLWTTDTLSAKLKEDFPALKSDHAHLGLPWEELIVSEEIPYRRLQFSSHDLRASRGMHGPCGQSVTVWLAATGEIAGTYVAQMSCPL